MTSHQRHPELAKGSIRKAMIPLAELGIRFLTATKPQPKAILPLVVRQILQPFANAVLPAL